MKNKACVEKAISALVVITKQGLCSTISRTSTKSNKVRLKQGEILYLNVFKQFRKNCLNDISMMINKYILQLTSYMETDITVHKSAYT